MRLKIVDCCYFSLDFSGVYTCVASSGNTKAKSGLLKVQDVQDVPNPPKLMWVECNRKDVNVVFQAKNGLHRYRYRDGSLIILSWKIQYNTTFLPDTWETAAGENFSFIKVHHFLFTNNNKTQVF